MIGLYRRLLRNVRSVNRLNRVHIALENTLTPGLAWQLSPQVAPSPATCLLAMQGPTPGSRTGTTIGETLFLSSEEWRERLTRHMALAGKPLPEGFVRRRLFRDVFVFSKPEARAPKRLLIVFAGGAMRPMMPLHVFLQHLDAETTDVLFLRDPARDGFRGGLRGLGTTIDAMVDKLPDLIDLARYDGFATLGTSAGGMPALLAGLTLGARSILSVGGNHPSDDRWTFRGLSLSESLPELRTTSGRCSRIVLIWGAQSPEDQLAAEATAALVGAVLVPVSDKHSPVRHGALFPLVQQQRLIVLLEALLSANTDELPLAFPSLRTIDVARARGSAEGVETWIFESPGSGGGI